MKQMSLQSTVNALRFVNNFLEAHLSISTPQLRLINKKNKSLRNYARVKYHFWNTHEMKLKEVFMILR